MSLVNTNLYNKNMQKLLKTFLLGLLAGFAIALGGLLFTLLSNADFKALPSFAFSIGLLLVCMFGFNLFTGKVGFFLEAEKKPKYLLDLLIMYIGNFVGALAIGYICFGFFSQSYDVISKIHDISKAREITNTNWLITFLGAVGCGMLVYTAVYAFKKDWPIGVRIVVLMFAVFAFVIAGFQHCIANMFYISFANDWDGLKILNILIVTFGNIVGAILLESITILIKLFSSEEKGLE